MKLLAIKIEKLYGTLTRRLSFNEQLNLLVGINGSGKTSVLHVVDWLLHVNWSKLCTTPFASLRLEFEHKEIQYQLVARQSEHYVTLSLKGGEGKFGAMRAALRIRPSEIETEELLSDLQQIYSDLHPTDSEVKLFSFLKSIPKPIVISLDRAISAETENATYIERSSIDSNRGRSNRRTGKTDTPLRRVAEVVTEKYNQYQTSVLRLNEVLKSRLLMSIFKNPTDRIRRAEPKEIDVDALERKVTQMLVPIMQQKNAHEAIGSFFSNVRAMRTNKELAHSYLFAVQFAQVTELAAAFKDFEESSTTAYQRIHNYLEVVNRFLSDSGKRLVISPTGRLVFSSLSDNGKEAALRPIDRLSSGERQIIILFTFLTFIAEEHRLFIVDEPELSLHPKWQSEFLQSFLASAPQSTQLIIATHSPEIVARHKHACLLLRDETKN